MRDARLTSRICVSIGERTVPRFLQTADAEAVCGERFFEFCLEYLSEPQAGPEVVRRFCEKWPQARVLVTCRNVAQQFRGIAGEQLKLIEAAVNAGAWGFDLEVEAAEQAPAWLTKMQWRSFCVVSYHGPYSGSVDSISRRLEALPADVYKIALSNLRSEDLPVLLAEAQKGGVPRIVLAVGPNGVASRLLTPILGRSFTYAAPEGGAPTAPGQLSARVLRDTYRLDRIGEDAFCCIGIRNFAAAFEPGPEVYNVEFARVNANGLYAEVPASDLLLAKLIRNPPKSLSGIGVGARCADIALQYVNTLEPSAAVGRIVDTLFRESGSWIGSWELGDSVLQCLATFAPRRNVVVRLTGPLPDCEKVARLLSAYAYTVTLNHSTQAGVRFDLSVESAYSSDSTLGGVPTITRSDLHSMAAERQTKRWMNIQPNRQRPLTNEQGRRKASTETTRWT